MKRFYGFVMKIVLCVLPFSGIMANSGYELFKLESGLSVISTTITNNTATVQVYVRSGSAFESDSTSGINAILSRIILKKIQAKSAKQSINCSPVLEPEMVGFTFIGNSNQLEAILKIMQESIFTFTANEEDIAVAIEDVSNMNDMEEDVPVQFKNRQLLKKLWGADFRKIHPAGDGKQYLKLNTQKIKDYQQKFFQASNSAMCISSNLSRAKLEVVTGTMISSAGAGMFNPEQIIHVLELRPIVNYTQFIFPSDEGKEETGLIYQNPGARYDRRSSYCAFILNQILQDADLGNSFKATYIPNNFFGTFTLSNKVTSDKYRTSQQELNKVMENVRAMKYLTEENIAKAKDKIINQYRSIGINNPDVYMKQVASFLFPSDENYITSFPDSIQGVSDNDLRMYIYDYFVNRSGVMYTYTSKNNMRDIDSTERLYSLDESVGELKCMYDLNKTDLSGDSNTTNMDKILLWLKMNPDIHVQVNGFSDESEYNRVSDAGLQKFIDSIPTFKKAMPDFIKTGSMRPEAMRALKLMKTFYENGIEINRITGTSMVFSSDSREREKENRKCTFTFEKMKPTVSLKEYHFGKQP